MKSVSLSKNNYSPEKSQSDPAKLFYTVDSGGRYISQTCEEQALALVPSKRWHQYGRPLGKVVVRAQKGCAKKISFPEVKVRNKEWDGKACYVSFTAFPPESYDPAMVNLPTTYDDLASGRRPRHPWPSKKDTWLPADGFYWFDINGAIMGIVDVNFDSNGNATGGGGVSVLANTPPNLLFLDDADYLLKLLEGARDRASKTVGWAAEAFLNVKARNPFWCWKSNTSSALGSERAYLVDWALAERRTGFKFESMEAFEEWAAQQGLTVLGVVDAASASASESEDEM